MGGVMAADTSRCDVFSDFYAAEYGRLVGALRLVCAPATDAEDLAQEAMVRACLHWKRVRDMERPAGWLYATAFNLVRRRGRLREAHGLLQQPADSPPFERLDLVEALRRLPLSQRKAVVLRYVLDYSTADAAALLHVSPGALRALLHRGCVSLRLQPAFHDMEPEP
jgi:RNA polymerase sigma factor (sigma-70 family)